MGHQIEFWALFLYIEIESITPKITDKGFLSKKQISVWCVRHVRLNIMSWATTTL